MKKLITEFIGTYFLVLTIGMTVIPGDAMAHLAPLAIGSVLMVMIFAGGHISGAHYNPAVTLAVLIRGRISVSEAIQYMIIQIIGAVAASFTVMYLLGDKMPVMATDMPDTAKALVAEIIGTFALAYVMLNVATAKSHPDNSFYGLAIGFTVMTMAYTFGSISGGVFNPAVAIGGGIMKLITWNSLWIYLVACFAGGALAGAVFKVNNRDDV